MSKGHFSPKIKPYGKSRNLFIIGPWSSKVVGSYEICRVCLIKKNVCPILGNEWQIFTVENKMVYGCLCYHAAKIAQVEVPAGN